MGRSSLARLVEGDRARSAQDFPPLLPGCRVCPLHDEHLAARLGDPDPQALLFIVKEQLVPLPGWASQIGY